MKTTDLIVKKIRILFLILLLLFSFYCKSNSGYENKNSEIIKELIILYTNDEHGWMEKTNTHGGAAGMMGLWRQNENFVENGSFLILSGGDMWTGPAISTWFKGQSMIEVMNSMHYSAAAIGNHEFDFKVNGLMERLKEADFPFLSSNIRLKSTGETPDFAEPFIIIEINNIKIGIIGLSAMNTPSSAFPEYVSDYNFIDYNKALQETVPNVKASGAELLILIGHICKSEMEDLAQSAASLGISIIGGGHCHETVNKTINGVAIIESGSSLKNYVKLRVLFNIENNTVESIDQSIHVNQNGAPDTDVANIVAEWRHQTDLQLSEVIGYIDQEIKQKSPSMYNMIVDSWLKAFPDADIAMSNTGGVRQAIPSGDISLSEIVGVLPFENSLIQLNLSGRELIACLDSSLYVGGMTTIGGYFLANGTPIDNNATYKVIITDYIYSAYQNFPTYDSVPYISSINWRQPVINWIKSLNTSMDNPLDQYLDAIARQ